MSRQLTCGPEPVDSPPLPPPEGPLSEIVTRTIVRRPSDRRDRALLDRASASLAEGIEDPLGDLDLQLALDLCYELHFLSFRGVDPGWEWDPQLLELRSRMESLFLDALVVATSSPPVPATGPSIKSLRALEAPAPIGELADFVESECDLPQIRELLIHRLSRKAEATRRISMVRTPPAGPDQAGADADRRG